MRTLRLCANSTPYKTNRFPFFHPRKRFRFIFIVDQRIYDHHDDHQPDGHDVLVGYLAERDFAGESGGGELVVRPVSLISMTMSNKIAEESNFDRCCPRRDTLKFDVKSPKILLFFNNVI